MSFLNLWSGRCAQLIPPRRNLLNLIHLQRNNSSYLSSEYDCRTGWEKRMETNLLNKLHLEDFFHEIEKKYLTEEKFISAVDVDMYINKVVEEDNLEEAEELAFRLRKSSRAHETLPSTTFALVKAYLTHERTEDLMRIMNDRLNYGIFPDHHTCNILMNIFLTKENYKDAAQIASFLMLEEDFGPPTTKLFALFSCLKLNESGIPSSWEKPPEQVEEAPKEPQTGKKAKKPEEERIRVKFQRNIYFDDHFDLTNPRHVVGKTLAYLSFQLSEDETLKNSLELFGWALYDKWEQVEITLRKLSEKKLPVALDVVKSVTEMVTSRIAEMEASPDKTLPRPKLRAVPGWNLDPEEINECFNKLKWDDSWKHLNPVKELLAKSQLKTTDMNILSKSEELLKAAIAKNEQSEIELQLNRFKEWEELRIQAYEKQMTRYREEETLHDIARQKRELKEKEDRIFFFDNEPEWMLKQPPPAPDPSTLPLTKKGGKPVDDANYIPPQVHRAIEDS